MGFKDIIGQKEMAQRLQALADSGRLPHAIMLCGPEGAGKMSLAMALASYVLCTNRTDGDACGECPSCRMLRNWQHPDLHFSYPTIKKKSWPSDRIPTSDDYSQEWLAMLKRNGGYFSIQEWMDEMGEEGKKSVITVAESDRLTRILMMKSNQGGYKVSIIWLPERMNLQCENKILKLLEEPPAETLFILVSRNPELLLETIRSRVQRFDVRPIAVDDMAEALQNRRALAPDDARRIARISKGNWVTAQSLLEPGNESVQFFDFYVMLMRKAFMRDVKDLKKWSEQVATMGREKQLRMLEAFLRLTREYFMYNFHNADLIYMSQEEEQFAKNFARFVNEENVIGMYDLFMLAMRDIGQNANPKILFFDVAMKMAVMIRRGA